MLQNLNISLGLLEMQRLSPRVLSPVFREELINVNDKTHLTHFKKTLTAYTGYEY